VTKSIRVIKVGGRVQADPALPGALADAWHAAPSSLCVVHGGGDEISTLQRAMGVEPVFVGGRRATTERDVDLVRMALSGSANKRIVAALISAGVDAVGVSGEDAALIGARIAHGGTLGRVGEPSQINVRLLGHLLDGGFLPVISPVGRQVEAGSATESTALNVNGDDAAAAIAVALSATELLFVADVAGVLDAGVVIPTLDVDAAAELVARGTAAGGMAAKLDAASRALAGGVGKVRIGDLAAVRDPSAGTSIVRASHHASTEPAGTAAAAGGRDSTGY
jgi:acetylglutamate kinase